MTHRNIAKDDVTPDKPETAPRKGKDARRQAIIDVAREVFLSEGYAAASMAEIAARVGGSKGTLYNYFPSKEALFSAFVQAECEVEATMAYSVNEAEQEEVAAALSGIGKRLLKFVLSDKAQAIHRLVIAETIRFPELGRSFFEQGPKRGNQLLGEHMQRWMDHGLLKRADPLLAAEHFGALAKSGLHQQRLWGLPRPTEAEIDANLANAVRVFMAAYGV